MGKTPKSKHGNERRRPYNYPRNAQAQTLNIESRNYTYSTGNVPRRIPVYRSVPFQGIPLPVQSHQYFVPERGYRGKFRGGKSSLGRQRRQDLQKKRVFSPLQKRAIKKMMQVQVEVQDVMQEKLHETAKQADEQVIKNGPESRKDNNDKEEMEKKDEIGDVQVSDSNGKHDSNGINDDVSDDIQKEDIIENVEIKPKTSTNKDKRSRKSSTPKSSPKGKGTPKSKKDKKSEPEVEPEDAKEKEKTQTKKSELQNRESLTPEQETSVKIVSVETSQSGKDDSIMEIPIENNTVQNIKSSLKPQNIQSLSTEEAPSIDAHVKDSPRRSSRRSVRQTPPVRKTPEKADSSSVIILDNEDSISVLDVSRSPQDRSFAKSIRRISGRPSLRTLPAYNRSFNKPYTGSSGSVHSNISSRSITTNNDFETDSQESKSVQSRSGLWSFFHSTSKRESQVFSADRESTNHSLADDSGNDSEATTEPFEAASSISFGKRKIQDADVEEEHDKKKMKEDSEKNNSGSGGLFSLMSSPMNLFTNKLRGDKTMSSTPVQLLKISDVNDDNSADISVQEEVSEIHFEYSSQTLLEKENVIEVPEKTNEQDEVTPRRWCSIM